MIAVLLGAVLLAGCSDTSSNPAGSSGSPGGAGTPGASGTAGVPGTGTAGGTQPTGAPSPSAGGGGTGGGGVPTSNPVVAIGPADKGKTYTIAAGQLLTVTLDGTDWAFVDPDPATVLTPALPPNVANGTTSMVYRGGRPGTATATASRGGERFEITVIVR